MFELSAQCRMVVDANLDDAFVVGPLDQPAHFGPGEVEPPRDFLLSAALHVVQDRDLRDQLGADVVTAAVGVHVLLLSARLVRRIPARAATAR
jgi:hypothetical protein